MWFVVPLLDHSNMMIVGATCTALGEVARVLPLPLPDNSNSTEGHALLDLVKKLLDNITSTKLTSKVFRHFLFMLVFLDKTAVIINNNSKTTIVPYKNKE